jgi:sialic acid synthase SpsE
MSQFMEKLKARRPYIIAEIGVNHEGRLAQARRLIELAHEGGADAAKFQTYKAGKIASRHSPSYWDTTKEPTRSQYELFQKYDGFGPDEYRALARHCAQVGIDFLSTPFDDDAVELLDPLMSCFKLASADITNVPLLRRVAAKKKPILLSTGASNLFEVDFALDVLERSGATEIVLMHCVLNYPTPDANAHLGMITGLGRAYPERVIGYSDHTVPDERMSALTCAFLLGATVIEKHFTHDKTLPGNDHYHAMDAADCRVFRDLSTKMVTLMGDSTVKTALEEEAPAREHARRSIVAVRDLKAGHVIEARDITYKRPAHGISPVHWDDVIGMTLLKDVAEDTPLKWQDVVRP